MEKPIGNGKVAETRCVLMGVSPEGTFCEE